MVIYQDIITPNMLSISESSVHLANEPLSDEEIEGMLKEMEKIGLIELEGPRMFKMDDGFYNLIITNAMRFLDMNREQIDANPKLKGLLMESLLLHALTVSITEKVQGKILVIELIRMANTINNLALKPHLEKILPIFDSQESCERAGELGKI